VDRLLVAYCVRFLDERRININTTV
jgi:hypothetical protein